MVPFFQRKSLKGQIGLLWRSTLRFVDMDCFEIMFCWIFIGSSRMVYFSLKNSWNCSYKKEEISCWGMIKNLDYCCKVQTTSNNLVIKIFAHVPPRLCNYFHTSTRTSLSNAANSYNRVSRKNERRKKSAYPFTFRFKIVKLKSSANWLRSHLCN